MSEAGRRCVDHGGPPAAVDFLGAIATKKSTALQELVHGDSGREAFVPGQVAIVTGRGCSVTAITEWRRGPRHGSALAYKTHIHRHCPCPGRRIPGRGSRRQYRRPIRWETRFPSNRRETRFTSWWNGPEAAGAARPSLSRDDPDPREEDPCRGTQAPPRSLRDSPGRCLSCHLGIDRRMRVRRRPDDRLRRRQLPGQVPVLLLHLGLGGGLRRPGRRFGGGAGLPCRSPVRERRLKPLAGLRLLKGLSGGGVR